ncbi:MAG TPA: hypothetical protein VJQ55_02635 [Candidatus Binatia bacterium]|nr:hypothetical protein [Candidatus Binatia bacterium]
MRTPTRWLAALTGILLLASSCATFDYSTGGPVERINWREYNDC